MTCRFVDINLEEYAAHMGLNFDRVMMMSLVPDCLLQRMSFGSRRDLVVDYQAMRASEVNYKKESVS